MEANAFFRVPLNGEPVSVKNLISHNAKNLANHGFRTARFFKIYDEEPLSISTKSSLPSGIQNPLTIVSLIAGIAGIFLILSILAILLLNKRNSRNSQKSDQKEKIMMRNFGFSENSLQNLDQVIFPSLNLEQPTMDEDSQVKRIQNSEKFLQNSSFQQEHLTIVVKIPMETSV